MNEILVNVSGVFSQPMLAAACGRETMNSFLKVGHCKRMSVIILS